MSIYDDEGVPDLDQIGRSVSWRTGTIGHVSDHVLTMSKRMNGVDVKLCTITKSDDFEVLIDTDTDDGYFEMKLSDILSRVRELAQAAGEEQVEEAPAEPTLREFLVEFRKVVEIGRKHLAPPPWNSMLDWLDARLGKEGEA